MKYVLFVFVLIGLTSVMSQPTVAGVSRVFSSHEASHDIDMSNMPAILPVILNGRTIAPVADCDASNTCLAQFEQVEHSCSTCAILAALIRPVDLTTKSLPVIYSKARVLGLLRSEILRPPRV